MSLYKLAWEIPNACVPSHAVITRDVFLQPGMRGQYSSLRLTPPTIPARLRRSPSFCAKVVLARLRPGQQSYLSTANSQPTNRRQVRKDGQAYAEGYVAGHRTASEAGDGFLRATVLADHRGQLVSRAPARQQRPMGHARLGRGTTFLPASSTSSRSARRPTYSTRSAK